LRDGSTPSPAAIEPLRTRVPEWAEEGNVQAARELRDWFKLAGLDTGELPADAVNPEDMTPEQRAVARAKLEALAPSPARDEPLRRRIQLGGVPARCLGD
jgi:hypothetical protein